MNLKQQLVAVLQKAILCSGKSSPERLRSQKSVFRVLKGPLESKMPTLGWSTSLESCHRAVGLRGPTWSQPMNPWVAAEEHGLGAQSTRATWPWDRLASIHEFPGSKDPSSLGTVYFFQAGCRLVPQGLSAVSLSTVLWENTFTLCEGLLLQTMWAISGGARAAETDWKALLKTTGCNRTWLELLCIVFEGDSTLGSGAIVKRIFSIFLSIKFFARNKTEIFQLNHLIWVLLTHSTEIFLNVCYALLENKLCSKWVVSPGKTVCWEHITHSIC